MKVEILYDSKESRVKAVYLRGTLYYTRTYLFDEDGYVKKSITVFRDGTISIQ